MEENFTQEESWARQLKLQLIPLLCHLLRKFVLVFVGSVWISSNNFGFQGHFTSLKTVKNENPSNQENKWGLLLFFLSPFGNKFSNIKRLHSSTRVYKDTLIFNLTLNNTLTRKPLNFINRVNR